MLHSPSPKRTAGSFSENIMGHEIHSRLLLLDYEALDQLRRIDGGSLVNEMIESFLTDAPQRLEAAQQGFRTKDGSAIEMAVHSLKSVCGQLGAMRMQNVCEATQLLARAHNFSSIQSQLKRLEKEFLEVKRELQKVIRPKESG